MNYEDLKYLTVPLPEDILREKWSGRFENARTIIKKRLEDDLLPHGLKCRLALELNNMEIMEKSYTITGEEALRQIRQKIPAFTERELETLRVEGKVDCMYIEGELRYQDSFCATLFKVYPEMWRRAVKGDESDYSVLEDLVADLRDGQETACHIHIRQTLSIAPEAVREGKMLRVHIPMPCEGEHVKNLKIIRIAPEPTKLPVSSEKQPTVYFESAVKAGQKYSVEYEFDNVRRYVNLSKADLDEIEKEKIPSDVLKYTMEELPHMVFTPYLVDLAREIGGGEKNPLLLARRFYDYITTKTDYRFVRDYASIDNLSEYCAVNSKGDCGVQALLFITLCRICGIPAKWESGLDAKPNDVGEHDWAMFYIPSIGWLHADLSYGGSSYIRGAYKRWNYFFGNADPYRIPINSEFQRQFEPAKRYMRADPYDNQCGEAEYDDCGLKAADIVYEYEEIDIHRIK